MTSNDPELVRLSTFSEMAKDISSSRSIGEAISQVMHHIGLAYSPVNWSLLLRNEKTGELKFIHVTGEGSDGLRGIVLAKGQGIAGWVAENGEAAIVADVETDPRFFRVQHKSGFVTKSVIAVPLRSRGKVYGVIELINKWDETLFTPLDLHLLQTIADLAAIAIERVYLLKTVRRMALTDPLTGLANRRNFERALDKEIEKTRRTGTLFSLLVVDINHFKSINDTHGHVAGDRVLKTLAGLLLAGSRKVDTCARLGGDEFAVLLPDTGDVGASYLLKRLQAKLEEANLGADIKFTVSIGARVVDPDKPQEIMGEADKAMYRQKSAAHEDALEDMEDQLSPWLAVDDNQH